MQITVSSLDARELKELLLKSWMTHDGTWFYNCLQEVGIERTNRINRAASRSLGTIEINRIRKSIGIDSIESFEVLKALLTGTIMIVKADFMTFDYDFPADNVFRMEFQRCFAYEGVKKIGVLDKYQCGIFDRIEGWFEALGLEYSVTPRVDGCMMLTEGYCYRNFEFNL